MLRFREGVSHAVDSGKMTDSSGTVRLKLFNLLLAELGPTILARRVILEKDELQEILRELPPLLTHVPHDSCMVLLSATFGETT